MIAYNPKDWFFFIFRLHKTDTVRKLFPLMLGLGIYTWLVAYLEMEYWKLSPANSLGHLTVMHSTLTFVISLLLVFRTNTAYDRWWEGRKQWGALVNCSRNFALQLSAILTDENDRAYFRRLIAAYAYVLAKHLKNEQTGQTLFEDFDLQEEEAHRHHPMKIASLMHRKVNELYSSGKISGDQLIVLGGQLQAFSDVCGACERIKNTPIPFSYSSFIKRFVFFYIMTLPFGYVVNLGYYVVPLVVFTFYVLASLELIAEEIEDPFGNDANDLPVEKIAEKIKAQAFEIL